MAPAAPARHNRQSLLLLLVALLLVALALVAKAADVEIDADGGKQVHRYMRCVVGCFGGGSTTLSIDR